MLNIEQNALFQSYIFSPPRDGSMMGFSSDFHCENLIKLLKVKHTKMYPLPPHRDWVPLRFLSLRHVQTEPPAIFQLPFRFSCSSGFLHKFLLVGFCFSICVSLYLCLPNFRGSGLLCNLIPLMDIRKVVDFSVCSTFYLLF